MPGINIDEIRKNMKRGGGQILDTLGMEFESTGLSQRDVAQILMTLPEELQGSMKVTRDASSEMNTLVFQGNKKSLRVNYHTEAAKNFIGLANMEKVGYELVSVPLEASSLELLIWALLPKLQAAGDFSTERCALHFHVGFPNNIIMMRNALKLGLWFDDVFYAIAGMAPGVKFRGHSNNAIYARPLVNGPYFRYNGNYYQTLNWEKALTARSSYDFFACYALDVNNGNHIKYHPARYFAINIYSVLLHGTLEFRHFNETFNPLVASAVSKLCQVFAEAAIKVNPATIKNFDVADVFTKQSPSYYLDKLYKLLDLGQRFDAVYTLSRSDIRELERLIYNYPGIGIEDVPVLTHVKEVETNGRIISDGELKLAKKRPIPDGHIDIHNIDEMNVSIL